MTRIAQLMLMAWRETALAVISTLLSVIYFDIPVYVSTIKQLYKSIMKKRNS